MASNSSSQQLEQRTARRAVLIGRTGSGKSTLANMLVKGSLDKPQPAPIGHGLRGMTVECKGVSGREWTVMDTVGMGEASCGTVPDKDARQKVVTFLNQVKGSYTHLIFVIDKGRLDSLDRVIWKTFLEVFGGARAEEHYIVLYTKADQSWLDSEMPEIQREFPECHNFTCANFPPPSDDHDDEQDLAAMRTGELQRLEAELDRLVPPNTWFTPDITNMTNAETVLKAESILRKIARLITELVRENALRIALDTVSIIINVLQIVSEFGS